MTEIETSTVKALVKEYPRVNRDFPDRLAFSNQGDIYPYKRKSKLVVNNHLPAQPPDHEKFQECKGERLSTVHGVEIWTAEGGRIRSMKKNGYGDFTDGGHSGSYPFIPLNEVWIDEDVKPADRKHIIWKELFQRRLMLQHGMPYGVAYDIAAQYEASNRAGRERHLPVGTHRQRAPGWCAPAHAKIYLDFLAYPIGRQYSELEIAACGDFSPEIGWSPDQLIAAVQKLGFQGYQKENMTKDDVSALRERGIPVIANHQFEGERNEKGSGHYSIIIGETGPGDLIFSDASEDSGYKEWSWKSFEDHWFEREDDTIAQGIWFDVPSML